MVNQFDQVNATDECLSKKGSVAVFAGLLILSLLEARG
jgi:hypothetical protein